MSKKTIHTNEYRILLRILRSKRQQKLISQDTMAAKLGVHQSFVSKVESGERRLDVIELKRYCDALELDFPRFIRDICTEIDIGRKVG